jgi:hypothetical protein
MRYRRTIIAALVMAALVACAQEAPPPPAPHSVYPAPPAPAIDAAALVVALTGHDGAEGTPAAPLRTIEAAAERARPGDTILVRTGIYDGDVQTRVSGTESERITFVAESPDTRIVGAGDAVGAWENDGHNVDIVGFDITGANEDGLFNRGSQVRLMKNRVHDIPGNCIYTANDDYSLTDIDVLGNVTFNCGEDRLDHGIYVTHQRGVVANNISYDSTGYGIQCWHACSSIAIVNNLVFANQEGGIVIGGNDDDLTVGNSLVANNIAVGNGREGIRESGESGDNNRFVNNLLWGNDRDSIQINGGEEAGTIVADPQFVNFQVNGSGDYRLEPSSPAVDAGAADLAPPVAIDRAPRPQSRGFDVGPYEQ